MSEHKRAGSAQSGAPGHQSRCRRDCNVARGSRTNSITFNPKLRRCKLEKVLNIQSLKNYSKNHLSCAKSFSIRCNLKRTIFID